MNEPVKGNLLSVIGLTIIGIALLLMLLAGYLAFKPVTVLKPLVQPYKILTPVVKVGDKVIYQVDVCKYHEATGVVTRSLVDQTNTAFPLPPTRGSVKPGCMKTNVPVIVPQLHSGTWHLTLDVGYKVNPLRTEYYHLVTDKFTIEAQ